ncbi:MAG: outer membrane beta-barrel protein [Terrimonas sp.]|nr:outer membrane beta-barrel protein [Terrimonas sp.]
MKKIITTVLFIGFISTVFAQAVDSLDTKTKKDWSKVSLAGRPNDHFMLQLGYAGWSGAPDSINIKGFSKSFNVYFMLDFPFKTDPRFSVAIGPGIGTDNIKFENTYIGVKDQTSTLRFQDLSDTNHFKKYKLVSAFLEAPVELRFSSNPLDNKKSFKFALGLKVGTLLDIHTKGKEWVTKSGSTLNNYSEKEKKKDYFNKNRLSATARIGKGNFTLYGSYQLGPLIKEGLGPSIKPYSIGLTLSGL